MNYAENTKEETKKMEEINLIIEQLNQLKAFYLVCSLCAWILMLFVVLSTIGTIVEKIQQKKAQKIYWTYVLNHTEKGIVDSYNAIKSYKDLPQDYRPKKWGKK